MKGFGASYGHNWIQGSWSGLWTEFHINILELYPILALIETFGHKFRNSIICFHCDNSSVVDVLNKQSSKDERIMAIMRRVVLKLLSLNTRFFAVHIPGVTNDLYNALSRFQEEPEMLQIYGMALHPSLIPNHALPINFKIP